MIGPPSKTPEQQHATDLYALMMEEVKIRHLSIQSALGGHLVFPAWVIREFCYLQLRMICELIALGCLVAHGDIKETRSKQMRKTWHPDEIYTQLGGLHADFYPVPIDKVGAEDRTAHFTRITSGFLTKDDLLTLHGTCGRYLHRGTMKNLLRPDPIYEEFPDVLGWTSKIQTLLRIHLLALFDGSLFMCVMSDGPKGEVVTEIAAPVRAAPSQPAN